MSQWSDPLVISQVEDQIKQCRETGAIISGCQQYRYLLWRMWNPLKSHPRWVTFVLLNPSTADAIKPDPTLKKCIGFAKRWGYDGVLLVNLFAFRTSKPVQLKKASEPVNDVPGANNGYIAAAVTKAEQVICGWGNHGNYLNRSEVVRHQLRLEFPGKAFHLGPLTKSGEPGHPLYIKYEAELLAMI